MDKTLFFKRQERTGIGGATYAASYFTEYWWTHQGAEDPMAPDERPDPFAAHRGSGTIRKFFTMVKTLPDEWTPGKRKRNLVSILGADWNVDANEALTPNATYEGIKYVGKFALLRDALCDRGRRSLTHRRSWERQFDEIKNRLTGQTWKINSQEDRWFYRTGRVEVTDTSKGGAGEVTIEADCDPWKYEMYSSMDEWEWDNLDFERGVIRDRADYTLQLEKNQYGAAHTGMVAILPLEKPEPVWINVNDDSTGNDLALYWDGSTPPESANVQGVTSEWRKTAFVPNEEHYVLKIRNMSARDLTVRVYYRGAMR